MNNEEFINKKVQKVIDIYENIENELLLKIVEHFKYNEEFLNSDHWRIKKLEEMGLFNREVINYIAKVTKKTPEQIKKALKDIGYDNINIETLNKAFKDNKLKVLLGVCRGKKNFDKRETIKERDLKREVAKNLKYS